MKVLEKFGFDSRWVSLRGEIVRTLISFAWKCLAANCVCYMMHLWLPSTFSVWICGAAVSLWTVQSKPSLSAQVGCIALAGHMRDIW